MSSNLQHARIKGPLYGKPKEAMEDLPRGPCLLEQLDDESVNIIWGQSGEHCAQVMVSEIKRATAQGDFALLP